MCLLDKEGEKNLCQNQLLSVNGFCYRMAYRPLCGGEQGEILLMNYSVSNSTIILFCYELNDRFIYNL